MDAPSKKEFFLVVIIGTTLLFFDDFSREGSAFYNLSIIMLSFLIKK